MCIVLYYPPFAHTTNLKMFCASVLWPLADCSCKWSKAALQLYFKCSQWFFTVGVLSILFDSVPSGSGHLQTFLAIHVPRDWTPSLWDLGVFNLAIHVPRDWTPSLWDLGECFLAIHVLRDWTP
ncbi:uncharacterized protein EDB91DRAFT_1080268 [Suillus paluster]|uniref:uncharacterized protein n=1 Tax=Suillus paluster TaxID=48578 RepID=UPI001B874F8B|nr:uncharacterized protein EDB91DRAFT_1080268 [Suillus paluster]KAG1746052.1 hypothetical protein EDB91DRAFT_1080268 [Suillus paluster]